MRRALIADIHGNSVALEAVLRDCEAQKVDEILCLGDMIGFLPDSINVIDLVRKSCKFSLSGDHELSLFLHEEIYARPAINKVAQNALNRQRLKPSWYSSGEKRARWKWLQSLEPKTAYAGALFVHGSPRDPVMEFILPNDFESPASQKILDNFACFHGQCFGAHTHIPGVARSETEWQRPQEGGMTFQLEHDRKIYVNVGSVGQPRDGDPRSCYVIWDDAQTTAEFRRVEYNIAKLRARFADVPEVNDFYFERLEKGI